MSRTRRWRWAGLGAAVSLLLAAACGPEIEDGKFSCISSDEQCPEGFSCQLDQRCHLKPLDSCSRCGDLDRDGVFSDGDIDVLNVLRNDAGFRPNCSDETADLDSSGTFDQYDDGLLTWLVLSENTPDIPQCDEAIPVLAGSHDSCGSCSGIDGDINSDGRVDVLDWDALILFPCLVSGAETTPPFCATTDLCLIRKLDQHPDARFNVLDADAWRIKHCPDACDIPTEQSLVVCDSYAELRNCLLGTCPELDAPTP